MEGGAEREEVVVSLQGEYRTTSRVAKMAHLRNFLFSWALGTPFVRVEHVVLPLAAEQQTVFLFQLCDLNLKSAPRPTAS